MHSLLQKIDQLQEKINRLRPLNRDEKIALKDYFRIGLTYSSNALEGNSLTESETKVILEDGLTVGGKPLRDVLEAVGHSNAYDFMIEMAESKQIVESDIKKIHALFYQVLDTKNAGIYRKQRVFISGSHYELPEPAQIGQLMKQMINSLPKRRDELHPVEFAAKLHKEFVYIHPFVDGNGRVFRLLMNLSLLQEGYPIVIIPPIMRSQYITALEKAHVDEQVFFEFIAECVVESQKDYLRLLGEK